MLGLPELLLVAAVVLLVLFVSYRAGIRRGHLEAEVDAQRRRDEGRGAPS